jgi:hypothetical protein
MSSNSINPIIVLPECYLPADWHCTKSNGEVLGIALKTKDGVQRFKLDTHNARALAETILEGLPDAIRSNPPVPRSQSDPTQEIRSHAHTHPKLRSGDSDTDQDIHRPSTIQPAPTPIDGAES